MKVIYVDRCLNCPHRKKFYPGFVRCMIDEAARGLRGKAIPEWCPLEDASETGSYGYISK